jgi:hypothetical protein
LISDELKDTLFSCDLEKCKGACCVEGDTGAPLEDEEVSLLEDFLNAIIPLMTPGGIKTVRGNGVFDYDAEGKFVTPLVEGRECAYAFFSEGIARCAIEEAYRQKKIPFPKPVSCHLYPIRVKRTLLYETVNYHKWPICRKALEKGYRDKIYLYEFLRDALIRKFGRGWYNELIRSFR